MIQPFYFRSFEKGVVSHLPATKLTDVASPRALNAAFRHLEGGTLTIGRRPGFTETGALSAPRTIMAQAWFYYTEDGVTTIHHVVVADNGTLWSLSGGVATALTIPTGTGEFLSASVGTPADGVRFVQLNNVLLGFMQNGTHFKIYRLPSNSTLYVGRVGLPTPDAPTFSSSAAGSLNGTIDIEVTYYNSNTGTESSPSSYLTRSAVNEALTIAIPTTGPTEVDKVRVYLRKQELQIKFRRSAALEVALGTASVVLDFTDVQLNQMTLSAPAHPTVNDRPVASLRDATVHLSRVFVTDGSRLYYSQVGNGEQFDSQSVELVNPEDGQVLMALRTLNDETLGIWKERSVHGMLGQTVASWSFDQLIPELGCISTDSLIEGDGLLGWWSEQGPVAWSKASAPSVLTDATIKGLFESGVIYLNRRNRCKAGYDPLGHRFLFSLDRADTANPWSVVPWSTAHKAWESTYWDLGTIQSLALGKASTNEMRLFFSGAAEVVYEMSSRLRRDNATEDSADAYRLITAGTVNAVTLASGSPSVNARGSIARLINTRTLQVHRGTYALVGTTLTWTTPSSFTPAAGDIVVFDSGITEWDTVDSTAGAFENEKRFLQTYCDVWTNGDTPILVGAALGNERTRSWARATTIEANDKNATIEGPTLTGAVESHRRWLGRRARWLRLTFLGWYPLTDWHLSMLGFTASYEGDES